MNNFESNEDIEEKYIYDYLEDMRWWEYTFPNSDIYPNHPDNQ